MGVHCRSMPNWNTTVVINNDLLFVDNQKEGLGLTEKSSQQYRFIEIAEARLENVTHLISLKEKQLASEHDILVLTTTHIHHVKVNTQLAQARH